MTLKKSKSGMINVSVEDEDKSLLCDHRITDRVAGTSGSI